MSKYYSLYNNIKLRKGGRKIAKLSETQFVEKAKAFILNVCKDDTYTVDKINNTNASNKIIATLPRLTVILLFSSFLSSSKINLPSKLNLFLNILSIKFAT